MNRTIKFRAWVIGNGWLDDILNDAKYWLANDGKTLVVGEDEIYDVGTEVIICFYTGLHDKNGKEIYSGDIVYDSTDNGLYKVIYSNYCASFRLQGISSRREHNLGYLQEHAYKVIGNTYENPVLIK